MAMNYLTVQDVLHLHLKVTGSTQAFDYAKLEEAANYQYGSGKSTDLAKQGARFLTGFVKMAPFASGNEACAFAGLVSFLEANGKTLDVSNAAGAAWASGLFDDLALAEEAIRDRAKDAHLHLVHGVPNFAEICESVVTRYVSTLKSLVNEPVASP